MRASIISLALLSLLSSIAPSIARAQTAVIEGVARAIDGDTPITFALVRLVAADSGARASHPSMQGITSAEGRYRFGGVAAGRYRVELLRIGFIPTVSDVAHAENGETVRLDLRVTSRAVTLPPVNVAAASCLTADAFAAYPRVATLWQQARGGASIREGLMATYRFRSVLREDGVEIRADGPSPVHTSEQPLTNDPKSALQNASRIRARRLASGYYYPNDGWGLPNELDVLHEEFFRTHCLDTEPVTGEGEIGLRFHPVRSRRDFLDVGGTIWLDSATFLARRIDLAYVDGDDARGTVTLEFGDLTVEGAPLRMPVGGAYAMRPSRRNPAKRTEGKLTFTYSEFMAERPR